jgi:hypothetical protein
MRFGVGEKQWVEAHVEKAEQEINSCEDISHQKAFLSGL